VDLVTPSLASLLAAIDGRAVSKTAGAVVTLRTAGAAVRELRMTPFQRLLSALAHPNIAYILMTLGFLGLYFELAHPGAILPGVVGGICLVLALFALSVLPVNYAGVALVAMALVFFIAEIKVPSYGLLTVGGVVALVLGGLMLFKTPDPALRVSVDLLVWMAVAALAAAGGIAFLAVRAQRGRVRTGSEGLVGERGAARSALDPEGKVFVHGELWHAIADQPVPAGTKVEVVEVEGMTLKVRRAKGGEAT
jgi:membrane-bound serine protease (ClpP class)